MPIETTHVSSAPAARSARQNVLTNLARLVDVTRLDTHLAAQRVDDAGAVGAYETRLALALERVDHLASPFNRGLGAEQTDASAHLDLVGLGDALGDADNEPNLVLDGLEDSVCGGGRRDIKHGRVGLRLLHSLR